MERVCLLIVDPQNDFITGSLAVPEAKKAIYNIINRIKDFDKTNVFLEVIVTRDWHPANHCSFKQWPSHCIQHTLGAQIPPELHQAITNFSSNFEELIKGCQDDKDEYSIFENTIESSFLTNILKEDECPIIVCGLAGDYCVKQTLADLIKIVDKSRVQVFIKGIASIDGGTILNDFIIKNNLKTI